MVIALSAVLNWVVSNETTCPIYEADDKQTVYVAKVAGIWWKPATAFISAQNRFTRFKSSFNFYNQRWTANEPA